MTSGEPCLQTATSSRSAEQQITNLYDCNFSRTKFHFINLISMANSLSIS